MKKLSKKAVIIALVVLSVVSAIFLKPISVPVADLGYLEENKSGSWHAFTSMPGYFFSVEAKEGLEVIAVSQFADFERRFQPPFERECRVRGGEEIWWYPAYDSLVVFENGVPVRAAEPDGYADYVGLIFIENGIVRGVEVYKFYTSRGSWGGGVTKVASLLYPLGSVGEIGARSDIAIISGIDRALTLNSLLNRNDTFG